MCSKNLQKAADLIAPFVQFDNYFLEAVVCNTQHENINPNLFLLHTKFHANASTYFNFAACAIY